MRAWAPLGVLTILLAAALLGTFGGQPHPTLVVRGDTAVLQSQVPAVLRNGELFEMRLQIRALRPIAKPVLAVSRSYWRDLTINSMIPAASEESSDARDLLFTFDALDAGEVLELKVDGQINPPLFAGTAGTIAVRDGETTLVSQPVRLRVWP